MAPLRPPSTFDDLSDDDLEVDPLDLSRARAGGHRWPAVFDGLVDRYRTLPASPGRVAAVVASVLLLGLGAWWLLRPASPPVEASLPVAANPDQVAPAAAGATAATTAAVTSTTAATELVVQAAGAVARPGVYRLPSTARVDDLVRTAGGFRPDADGDRVNLAAPLLDGARVWVPAQGEDQPPEVISSSGGTPAGGSSGGPTSGSSPATVATPEPVDLNTASAEQLDTLPGVGPSTAAAILAYRDEHGPFSSIDDLLEVRGIGEAKLEQIRPLARV